jgi:hypothetical protein
VPIVLDTAGDPLLPNPNYGEGHVSAQNHVEEPPLLHRPHAFALMHGDGGAKIAYGQFMWRFDHLSFQFSSGMVSAVGQPRDIKGYEVSVPHVGSATGNLMSSDVDGVAGDSIPAVYHELDSFGTVYLYWDVEWDNTTAQVKNVWVQVGDAGSLHDTDSMFPNSNAHNRLTNTDVMSTETDGRYRLEIGSVNDSQRVVQKISSDVYWSTVLATRA